MKRAFALLAVLLLALTTSPAATAPPPELVDALGDTLRLADAPLRVISLAPSNTEIVYAVGAGDRLVGVTEYCNYPPEAEKVQTIGGFSNPNLELIVSLQPDLVLGARFNPLEVLAALRRLDVPVFVLAPRTLEETFTAIRQVGSLTGRTDPASRLEALMKARIESLTSIVETIPAGSRPRVLWGKLGTPMYTAGPGSFIDDLIRLAGGQNVAADAQTAWFQVGLETIVSRDPQIILVSSVHPETIARDVDRLRKTPGWEDVDAIVNGQVHHVDMDILGRPGPRLIDGLEILAGIFHPARFAQ